MLTRPIERADVGPTLDEEAQVASVGVEGEVRRNELRVPYAEPVANGEVHVDQPSADDAMNAQDGDARAEEGLHRAYPRDLTTGRARTGRSECGAWAPSRSGESCWRWAKGGTRGLGGAQRSTVARAE